MLVSTFHSIQRIAYRPDFLFIYFHVICLKNIALPTCPLFFAYSLYILNLFITTNRKKSGQVGFLQFFFLKSAQIDQKGPFLAKKQHLEVIFYYFPRPLLFRESGQKPTFFGLFTILWAKISQFFHNFL